VLSVPSICHAQAGEDLIEGVLKELNKHESVEGSAQVKSYEILFDAYLGLSEPPFEIGESFNQNIIHPGMSTWPAVASWAESNSAMANAVLACKDKLIIGLPYGIDNVPQNYRDANIVADIGSDGSLNTVDFPYLDAVDVIAAFVTAETYRLHEAGKSDQAVQLSLAHIYVLRQWCDRQFLDEKMYCILMMIDALRVLRDQFYLYRDAIPTERYISIGWNELPFLKPDRNHLFMPEGDRVVSEALIRSVFDPATSRADAEMFAKTFTGIQAQGAPMTRFGAARRWQKIALVHDSLEASLERLKLVYDDWWRRWRVQEYDIILEYPTMYEITNPIRYAAVIYAMRDIQGLFNIRNLLIAEVNGTAVSAALCAYHRSFDTYPSDKVKVYSSFLRKRASDFDPFSFDFEPLRYRMADKRLRIETAVGFVWVEPGTPILWSIGANHENNWAEQHSYDGETGDVVFWPPMRAFSREAGLLQ
jgi:hypothetical protein